MDRTKDRMMGESMDGWMEHKTDCWMERWMDDQKTK